MVVVIPIPYTTQRQTGSGFFSKKPNSPPNVVIKLKDSSEKPLASINIPNNPADSFLTQSEYEFTYHIDTSSKNLSDYLPLEDDKYIKFPNGFSPVLMENKMTGASPSYTLLFDKVEKEDLCLKYPPKVECCLNVLIQTHYGKVGHFFSLAFEADAEGKTPFLTEFIDISCNRDGRIISSTDTTTKYKRIPVRFDDVFWESAQIVYQNFIMHESQNIPLLKCQLGDNNTLTVVDKSDINAIDKVQLEKDWASYWIKVYSQTVANLANAIQQKSMNNISTEINKENEFVAQLTTLKDKMNALSTNLKNTTISSMSEYDKLLAQAQALDEEFFALVEEHKPPCKPCKCSSKSSSKKSSSSSSSSGFSSGVATGVAAALVASRF